MRSGSPGGRILIITGQTATKEGEFGDCGCRTLGDSFVRPLLFHSSSNGWVVMGKIFVSCGQYTDEEKSLGKTVVKMVKSITGKDAFFAEQVQDLNGLDSNILSALRDADGFITILHPRGTIIRPNSSTFVRASVWIEQEIAIATYIQRIEKRPLPVIAFIHESVGREGIRDLLHLNPIPFEDESDVLAALPDRLAPWKNLVSSDIRVELKSDKKGIQQDHWIRELSVEVVNNSNNRITNYNCELCIPKGLLHHWSAAYPIEVRRNDSRNRYFKFDENTTQRAISPRSTERLVTFEYCIDCAREQTGEGALFAGIAAGEMVITAKMWIDGREYSDRKTTKQLIQESETVRIMD